MLETDHVRKLFELGVVHESISAAVPPRIKKAIDRYVWYGVPPGGFTEAVLSNDLMSAIGRADADSLAAIYAICGYVYYAVPSSCHGTRVKVHAHIDHGLESVGIQIPKGAQ